MRNDLDSGAVRHVPTALISLLSRWPSQGTNEAWPAMRTVDPVAGA
ncbi:MAG TPA: hypothetical protein VIM24_02670 [Candidatus Limnocylindrales bacterium]